MSKEVKVASDERLYRNFTGNINYKGNIAIVRNASFEIDFGEIFWWNGE